jgi:hypothetical protein
VMDASPPIAIYFGNILFPMHIFTSYHTSSFNKNQTHVYNQVPTTLSVFSPIKIPRIPMLKQGT